MTYRLDHHQCQISITVIVTRRPVYFITVNLYLLVYDATDVTDNDNLATGLSTQIQISVAQICMVRKPTIEPIVLAKQWGVTPEKAQKTIQATTQRDRLELCFTLSC